MTGLGVASTVIPAQAFADPSRDAQRSFRAVLDALAHPGRAYPLPAPAQPLPALGPGLAAVMLTVLDEECSVWLGGALADDAGVASWLVFHTGVRRASAVREADFVVAAATSCPPLASLALGTDEEPHRSATVVLDIRGTTGTARFTATGPGIDGTTTLLAPWAGEDFTAQWRHNGALFPRGVDLLLVDERHLTALPRTTRLTPAHPVEEA